MAEYYHQLVRRRDDELQRVIPQYLIIRTWRMSGGKKPGKLGQDSETILQVAAYLHTLGQINRMPSRREFPLLS